MDQFIKEKFEKWYEKPRNQSVGKKHLNEKYANGAVQLLFEAWLAGYTHSAE